MNTMTPKTLCAENGSQHRFCNTVRPQGQSLWTHRSGCRNGIAQLGERHEVEPARAVSSSESDDLQNSEAMNFKALNYTELIPILIKAIQEQQREIEELKRLLESRN